jgi:flagellar motor switch protein FliM
MDTILEQNAIDQLFTMRQAARESDDLQTPAAPYNFGRAGRIGTEQMRAVSVVNEQFARSLTHSLGAWLRTQLQVAAAAGEQMSFGDFLSCLPEPSYVCLLRLEPLGGTGLLEVSLSVALAMVDLLLGGNAAAAELHEVTDIENAILVSVLQVVMRELNTSWKAVGLQFELEKQETHSRIARLMPASEQTLCVSLDVQMHGVQGLINLCLPAMVLNTMHRRLNAAGNHARKRITPSSVRVETLMADAIVPVAMRLPVSKISTRLLQTMQVGSLIELGVPRTTRGELRVGGVLLCPVLPVSTGDRLAAALENPIALPLLEAQSRTGEQHG